MSEQAELKGHIDRAREGIEKQLVEMGVQPNAATIAVRDQVKFGRAPNGSLLMKKGPWVAGLGYQRECAQHILPSIPANQRTGFREGDEEDDMWAAAEKNLAGASYTYTRAELLEQKREKEIEQARSGAPSVDDKTLSMEELIRRKQASNSIYGDATEQVRGNAASVNAKTLSMEELIDRKRATGRY